MNPPEEQKNVKRGESSEEVSLTRVKNTSTEMKNYTVSDGEFTSFPEVNATSAQQMIARGIKNLFPIQMHSFYPIYNREDVIARDLTGSGKTLAFCLPTTEYFRKHKMLGSRRIQAIILCPTRELAIQVSVFFTSPRPAETDLDQFEVVKVCVRVGMFDDNATKRLTCLLFIIGPK